MHHCEYCHGRKTMRVIVGSKTVEKPCVCVLRRQNNREERERRAYALLESLRPKTKAVPATPSNTPDVSE